VSRGKAWLRHQRRRVVAKRFHIQYDCWHQGHDTPGPHKTRYVDPNYIDDRNDLLRRSNKFSKWNLACSCGMCTMGKRPDKRRARHESKLALKQGKEPNKKIVKY
jgi:hypothetical protein